MAAKDAGLRIRVERSLRERFVRACQLDDKPAAQVIREFMRSYVKAHKHPKETPQERSRRARGKGNA